MYNKLITIGHLTKDIDLKYLQSGAAIAKGSIATSYKYKLQDGNVKEEVCFLDFNVFGKSAESINQFVSKGSKVMLEGRLIYETWVAQDGTNRSKHSLRVEIFKFLDSKPENQQHQNSFNKKSTSYTNHKEQYVSNVDIDEDEIPFN